MEHQRHAPPWFETANDRMIGVAEMLARLLLWEESRGPSLPAPGRESLAPNVVAGKGWESCAIKCS